LTRAVQQAACMNEDYGISGCLRASCAGSERE